MNPIQAGDRAPDFTAPAHNGQQVSLADFRGKHVVVLYFYPKDGTPVCTKEACSFRDAYEGFIQAGATVIGVSGDSPDSHRAFASRQRLPFLLLSDQEARCARHSECPRRWGCFPVGSPTSSTSKALFATCSTPNSLPVAMLPKPRRWSRS